MITYGLSVKKSGDIFFSQSPQFSGLNGFGHCEDEAFSDLLSKVKIRIQESILQGKSLPKSINPIKLPKQKGSGSFSFSLTSELSMALHAAMLAKGISRVTLANLLALTHDEVSSENWRLEKLLQLKPKAQPKYKKVQRLLDINHYSSINEMSEAFRVLDCSIGIQILDKTTLNKKSVVTL